MRSAVRSIGRCVRPDGEADEDRMDRAAHGGVRAAGAGAAHEGQARRRCQSGAIG